MKTKIEIKSVFGHLLFEFEKENNSVKETLLKAIKRGANLSGANLSGADLSNANLSGANLIYTNLSYANLSCANLSNANIIGANLISADLSYANLSCANLISANLSCANLISADLSYANLSCANLSNANLISADLSYANLSCANLISANLSCANLISANLSYANLSNANLSKANLIKANLSCANLSNANLIGANLFGAYYNESTSFLLSQCPSEGSFVGWKKAHGLIIKLLITETAKRSSATSLKCRCSEAKVLEIQNIDGSLSDVKEAYSNYDLSFIYRSGEIVNVDNFNEDRCNECSTGIHFFISREMAVKY